MPSSADYVDNAPPAFCSTAVPQRDAEATGKGVGGERSVADLQGSSEGETYAEGNGPEHAVRARDVRDGEKGAGETDAQEERIYWNILSFR